MVTYAEAKKQLEIARQQEVPKAIEKIHALMNEYGLTLADLRIKGRRGRPRKAGGAAKAKYKYMKDGMGYTGVGRRPAWVEAVLKAGENLEQYRVGGAAPAAAKTPVAAKAPLKKAAAAKKAAGLKKPAAKRTAKRPGKSVRGKAAK